MSYESIYLQMNDLIEGYSIKTTNGDIFDVRGSNHPNDGVIAYIKYDFDKELGYKRISSINEGSKYLQKYGSTTLSSLYHSKK